ncbi:MAG: cysteine--tRNA ligase [Fusobacteriaceae bacterium]|jgi:cysteinyl-tRNA synthetase|nr:cysteine--tRNA ligase [Fusobacteriaceae bacterium]
MIKIYNTLTGKLDPFVPVEEGKVSMYVCGPTVYNYIHVGNARPAIFFDTVRRWFEYSGYKVTYVQNFTDVDDKMIKRANEEHISLKEVADKYIAAYFEDTARINLKEEGMIRPKATENIKEMIEIVEELVQNGHAYVVDGDVYFRVKSYDEYGALSKKNTEDLLNGVRIDVNEQKEDPLDFALWKKAKEGEPSWESPWGKGRPGWHIECSAMSGRYLGKTFDIHGGGEDLIFPHHENEIAQSRCSVGGEFARYWMHNRYINIDGEKMSKSLGNFKLLRDILKHYDGNVLRLFILSSHYRKIVDFSDKELDQTKVALERIENALVTALEKAGSATAPEGDSLEELRGDLVSCKEKFKETMDEDFNTAQGLGVVFELIRSLNRASSVEKINAEGKEALEEAVNYIKTILEDVLGVTLKLKKEVSGDLTASLVELLIEVRNDARAKKDWAASDKIRDELDKLGVKLKDGKDKTVWTILK